MAEALFFPLNFKTLVEKHSHTNEEQYVLLLILINVICAQKKDQNNTKWCKMKKKGPLTTLAPLPRGKLLEAFGGN